MRAIRRYDNAGTILSLFGHNPSPRVLRRLIGWLTRHGFTFVSTDELLEMRDGRRNWQARTAWLTFDDGWCDFEKNLLPILREYNVPATIFVPPHESERGCVWTNSVMRIVPNWRDWYVLSADERYRRVEAILQGDHASRSLADPDELRRLAQSGFVTLENHTLTHLSCARRPVDEVAQEVEKTQDILASWTGRRPKLLCYPFGHCSVAADQKIKEMGLQPVRSIPGMMTLTTIGDFRNMFHDSMSCAENVGRVLQAWPKVNSEAIVTS